MDVKPEPAGRLRQLEVFSQASIAVNVMSVEFNCKFSAMNDIFERAVATLYDGDLISGLRKLTVRSYFNICSDKSTFTIVQSVSCFCSHQDYIFIYYISFKLARFTMIVHFFPFCFIKNMHGCCFHRFRDKINHYY